MVGLRSMVGMVRFEPVRFHILDELASLRVVYRVSVAIVTAVYGGYLVSAREVLSSGLSISWVLCALCFRFCVLVVSLPPVFIIAFPSPGT